MIQQFASGGGIGGLCLAVALSKFSDIHVDVYEAARSFTEVGAGVMIWGRTWRVMSLLGLDQTLREVAGVAIDGSEGAHEYKYQEIRFELGKDRS